MPTRSGTQAARWWIGWLLALAPLAACRVTDMRFTEGPAAPRLIAPISMSTVTSQTPRLRWVLGPGDGTPVVELCKDRACAQPLATAAMTGDDGLSAAPASALPTGWVYWRVRVARGGQEAVSATWQFWVGHAATGTPTEVDTSNGAILDVNGDGYADLLVGASAAPDPAGKTPGVVHVYLGSAAPTAAGWNGASAAQRIDVIDPADVQISNLSISSVGDVNGDGFGDFVVGVPFARDAAGSSAGAAYLYLGSAAPSADDWNGAAPRNRIDLVNPDGASATFGRPAVGVGDINRDGYADFLIEDSAFGGIQPVHVYLGSATPGAAVWVGVSAPGRIDLSNPDGVNAIFSTAAGIGDVNGDGYADFALGTTGTGTGDGAAHVYLGSATPSSATWNGDSPGARIDVVSPDGPGGGFSSVASAGDVNGDGFADLLVGATGAAGNLGMAHVYLGARDPAAAWSLPASPARIDLTSPDTALDQFGATLGSVGDINGDGLSDLLVTGFGSNFGVANSGRSHLYLGMRMPTAAAWNGASPPQRIDLIAPDGTSSGFAAFPQTTGDLNGDLDDDFAISAPDAGGKVGALYVYFGTVTPSANGWNGPTPSRRINLAGPDPAGSEFGAMR